MQKKVTLERDGRKEVVVLRQMPHDPQAIIGKRFTFAGKRWICIDVREAQ